MKLLRIRKFAFLLAISTILGLVFFISADQGKVNFNTDQEMTTKSELAIDFSVDSASLEMDSTNFDKAINPIMKYNLGQTNYPLSDSGLVRADITPTWISKNPSLSPSARHLSSMVYDAGNDKIILFGGTGSSGSLGDTWAYDYTTNSWVDLSPTISPQNQAGHAMVYNPGTQKVIFFGLGETWTYEYLTNTWEQQFPALSPPSSRYHGMIYDTTRQKIILMGGNSPSFETWEYDPSNNVWTNLAPVTPQTSLDGFAFSYDKANDKIIIFGGWNGAGNTGQTYAFDYSTNEWTELNPAVSPSERRSYSIGMAYDPNGEKSVLFGGFDSFGVNNETWAFDYGSNIWERVNTYNTPPASWQQSLIFNPKEDKFIMFGGFSTTPLDQTYELRVFGPTNDRILMLGTGTLGNFGDMTTVLSQFGYRSDILMVDSSIPNLSDLTKYPVIISWSTSFGPFDNTAWGNLLADYIDSGGSLIMMPFTYYQDPWSLAGRFQDDQYSPFSYVNNSNLLKSYTGVNPHPIMQNVVEYNTTLAMQPLITNGSTQIASYDDGTPFIAIKGKVLGINSFVPQNINGDISQMLANAVEFLKNMDSGQPTISGSTDQIIELGETGSFVSWSLSDENPSTYTIKLNSVLIDSGNWIDGEIISISLDGLGVGNYQVEMSATDLAGNTAIDVVDIQVIDTTFPEIQGPEDFDIGITEFGRNITWQAFDLDPQNYSVTHNGTVISQGLWQSNSSIVIDLDPIGVGYNIFQIKFNDTSLNQAVNTVIVRIMDFGMPSISSPDDLILAEGSTRNTITWFIEDEDPNYYLLFENGILVVNDSWVDLSFIEINLDGFSYGFYNFTLTLFDWENNSVSDFVTLNILQTEGVPPPDLGDEGDDSINLFENVNPNVALGIGAVVTVIGGGYMFFRRR